MFELVSTQHYYRGEIDATYGPYAVMLEPRSRCLAYIS